MFHHLLLTAVHATIQQGNVNIDNNRCKGCGLCVATCPAKTLQLSNNVNTRGYNFSQQLRPNRCIGCASCALICPDACITVFRTGLRKTI
ncbi:MAG: 4Fe-4S binding protein [Bacteroidales bacterium]|nr:4Fe-4S binding protein [Bacteroidales bacterium]